MQLKGSWDSAQETLLDGTSVPKTGAHQATPWSCVGNRWRERQCLTTLAAELRTAHIAERMQGTLVTVEYHLRNARRKLGAVTREEALANSIRQGLLEL